MEIQAQGGGDAHECERCGETFPTEEELDRHMADRHAGGEGPAPDDGAVPSGTGGARTEGGAGMVQTE